MIQSKKHLEKILKCSYAELETLAAMNEKYYYEKKEPKKLDNKGKQIFRVLHPSIGKLKWVQGIIKNAILRKIYLDDCVYGGVQGKDGVLNANVHKGRSHKFCTDLKSFFPSITSKMVYDSFKAHGFSSDVARILTKLTTYRHRLPQGARTSTHIANMVFTGIDDQIIEFCKPREIEYTRYVDDLTFSSLRPFKEETHLLLEIIKSHHFRISNRKTTYVKGSIEITGARVRDNGLSPTDRLKEKLNHPEKYLINQVKGHMAFYNRLKNI